MTQHIIDTDELEKRIKAMKCDYSVQCFDSANEVTAYNEGVENALIILRALLANSPQADDGMVALALNNTALQKRVAVLEDLLSSAYNIANRNGESTHWERFAGQLHINGISPITAKTFKILPSDTEVSAYKPQADDVRKDAWISVEDRLPPLNGDEVLAYRDDDDWIVICLFMDIGFAYFSE